MRNNLVMHLHCAECGRRLEIIDRSEENVENSRVRNENPTLPPGAAVAFVPPIQIEPCRHCIERYTRPAKELMRSIQALSAGGEL